MAIRKRTTRTVTRSAEPKVVVPEPEPDPDPLNYYSAKRWADLQASGYIWYPMRKVAIYDEGQAGETIAEP